MSEGWSRFPMSPSARRLVRSYGLLVLIAIGFLLMAVCIREKPKVVPSQGMGAAHVRMGGEHWR